jgi:hypothetical protein
MYAHMVIYNFFLFVSFLYLTIYLSSLLKGKWHTLTLSQFIWVVLRFLFYKYSCQDFFVKEEVYK